MADQQQGPLGTVFVVIDPTRLVQLALEKGEWIASRNRDLMHLYCCIWDADLDEDEQGRRAAIERTEAWIERIAAKPRAEGIDVTVEVEWDPDWRDQITAAAKRRRAEVIVKTSTKRSQWRRQLLKTSDWVVLRNSICPTLLVNPRQTANPNVLLAAVKLKPGDETHAILNQRVIDLAHLVANALGAELHAVTAYRGDDVFFDRQKFADSCRLPRNRVHAVDAAPHRGIAEVCEEIGAGAVVIGCAASQAPERGVIIGDTAQRVVDEVDADILVVPAG
jgi:nucleotide-binding universal stress UspA family protein